MNRRTADHQPQNGTTTSSTSSAQPPLPSIQQYHVLYYKQSRKVHKSKGVSKCDGILSINTATDVVSLFDGQPQESESSTTNRPLYSSLNHALAKRWNNLENEENVPVGQYQLDIVGKVTALCTDSGGRQQQHDLGDGATAASASEPANGCHAKPALASAPQPRRVILTSKRPLTSIHRVPLQAVAKKVIRTDRPTTITSSVPSHHDDDTPPATTNKLERVMVPTKNVLLSRPTKTTHTSGVPRIPPRQPLRPPLPPAASLMARCDAAAEESSVIPSVPITRTGLSQTSPHATTSVRTIRRVPIVPLQNRSKAPPILRSTAAVQRTNGVSMPSTAPTNTNTSSGATTANTSEGTLASSTTATAAAAATTANSGTVPPAVRLSHIPLPTKVSRVLRPHQSTGVNFLYTALRQPINGGGAILADEPGLGKTLMTIAIVAAFHRQQRHKHFCVVCPSSLVNNWIKEFDHWLGKEGQPKRVPLKKGDTSYNSSNMKSFLLSKTGQVVILSYELFRLHSHHFASTTTSGSGATNAPSFALLVVDEGHRLKSTSGSLTLSALEGLPCDARLLLSATPIQNNLGDFYTLANFCRPGVLGELHEFRRRFEKPILAHNSKNGSICPAQQELDQIASTFMLRRLQKDVLQSMLPPRSEFLVFCRPTSRQRQCYQDIVSSASIYGTTTNSNDALAALTSLRKLCSHPLLYESTDHAESLLQASTEADAVVHDSGKMSVLKSLLHSMHHNEDSSKVVIVSNFTSTLTLVESLLLKPLGYSFLRLDGNTTADDRQSMVDRFNKHQVFCFLLSSKAGGCGLNLIGANRLILLDPSWNPADDIQAMGRIYRQGQTRETFVYRFFTSGTIEEVIYLRQLQKGHLANIIDKKSTAFSRDEIKECFTLKSNCDCETKQKVGELWPMYNGEAGLRNLGCTDGPLLEITKSASKALGWVHLVRDQDELTQSLCPDSQPSQESMYHSANEVEFECDMALEKNQDAAFSTMSQGESSESEAEFEF